MIKAVLFDLDGTLVSSTKLLIEAIQKACHEFGFEIPDEAVIQAGAYYPLDHQFVLLGISEPSEELISSTYKHYQNLCNTFPEPAFSGAWEAVRLVRQKGLSTGIVTSRVRSGTIESLQKHEVLDLFDVIITVDDVSFPKPHPEGVEKALEHLMINASHAVMIGDSPHDLEAAHGAGVRSVAVLTGTTPRSELERKKPWKILASVADVEELFS